MEYIFEVDTIERNIDTAYYWIQFPHKRILARYLASPWNNCIFNLYTLDPKCAHSFVVLCFTAIMFTMTSSDGNIRVTGHLRGKFTDHRWIPRKRPVTRSVDVFFDLRLN